MHVPLLFTLVAVIDT